jgi:hypothetical protein
MSIKSSSIWDHTEEMRQRYDSAMLDLQTHLKALDARLTALEEKTKPKRKPRAKKEGTT